MIDVMKHVPSVIGVVSCKMFRALEHPRASLRLKLLLFFALLGRVTREQLFNLRNTKNCMNKIKTSNFLKLCSRKILLI